ncbi:uncharacterized protein [Macrobrachium rosenbergii]|uniref:uncharacterized protein n=1 Tax=Macrobrachium rosenbergii TaxID=79674 RepID=UPI0034D5E918
MKVYVNVTFAFVSSAFFILFQATTEYSSSRISRQIRTITRGDYVFTDQKPTVQARTDVGTQLTRRLLDLERELHLVSCVIRDLMNFVAPVVSLTLCASSVIVITFIYKSLTSYSGIFYAVGVLILFGYLFIPTHIGQVFTNRMREAAFDLRSIIYRLTEAVDRIHVHHLASRIDEMSRIDVNGCYN